MVILSAFTSGLLFGLGLIISQMINPAKVSLSWTCSANGTLASHCDGRRRGGIGFGYMLAKRRGAPVLVASLEIPTRRDLDFRLLAGATLFGVGWGLVGLCPGPALALLSFGLAGIPVLRGDDRRDGGFRYVAFAPTPAGFYSTTSGRGRVMMSAIASVLATALEESSASFWVLSEVGARSSHRLFSFT